MLLHPSGPLISLAVAPFTCLAREAGGPRGLSGQLCAAGRNPKSGRESKKHLAVTMPLSCGRLCWTAVSLGEGAQGLSLRAPQRCRASFALSHAVSYKLCFVLINSRCSDPSKAPGRGRREGLDVCHLGCLGGSARSGHTRRGVVARGLECL